MVQIAGDNGRQDVERFGYDCDVPVTRDVGVIGLFIIEELV
jgi:hypothetical protein